MWAIAYLAMMKPGLIIGELLFALTLACLFAGGVIAGRFARPGEKGWGAGLKAGLVAGLINLLLIGSLAGGGGGGGAAGGDDSGASRTVLGALALWMIGNLLISSVLGALGGMIGARSPRRHQLDVNWFGLFLRVAAVTVFLLLITGGLVTGLRAGLAVPDWPNSFGHNMLLYPLSQMRGGVYYEHAHRLYGMLVGVTAITAAASMFLFDDRRWLRALGIAYLIMVCIQGTLGGTRVTEQSIILAIIHGVFGQIVFATIVAMAAFTSTTWMSSTPAGLEARARIDRTLSLALVIMLIVQLGLGAMYRHLRREWDNPPEPLHPLYAHIALAGLVTLLTVFVAGRAWARGANPLPSATGEGRVRVESRGASVLPAVGQAMLILVAIQLILGVIALIVVWSRSSGGSGAATSMAEVVITTAHQATGALLLAAATLLMLWARRLAAAPAAPSARPLVSSTARDIDK
jgi:cytochrome c oxidase assembly protein subunit 15